MKKLSLLFLLSLIFLPRPTLAARFYFAPDKISAPPGEPFEVAVMLDSEGESINTVAGQITFPAEQLKLKEVKNTDALINFWLEKPAVGEAGQVKFSGIIPGGFSGLLDASYTGGRPAKIFSLILVGQVAGKTSLEWQTPQVLLNDGTGQAAALAAASLPITIAADAANSAPVMTATADFDPPELFGPEIARDPNLFDGQWFVTFTTRDPGSGLAGYEVAEHYQTTPDASDWQPATSPYRLDDQSRRSYVSIRARDMAGNERVVTLPPLNLAPPNYLDRTLWVIIILLCFVALCSYFYFSRRR